MASIQTKMSATPPDDQLCRLTNGTAVVNVPGLLIKVIVRPNRAGDLQFQTNLNQARSVR